MTGGRAVGAPTPWVKARASSDGGSCVELRRRGTVVEIRDSKNPRGPVLVFSPGQVAAWLGGAGCGEFARLAD